MGIVTGGDAASNPRFAPQTAPDTYFSYPDAAEPPELLDFKVRISPTSRLLCYQPDIGLVAACSRLIWRFALPCSQGAHGLPRLVR